MSTNIDTIIEYFATGGIVIVSDDNNREDECDLIMAAEFMTPPKMVTYIRHTTGIICVTITEEMADRLKLPQMVPENTDNHKTAFTVTVDTVGVSTGVSAKDRCNTVIAFTRSSVKPEDFTRPGHVFPLVARPGGTLVRRGHTEAAIDLCRLAGIKLVGVIAELQNQETGEMIRLQDIKTTTLLDFPVVTVDQIAKKMVDYYKQCPPFSTEISKKYWSPQISLASSSSISLKFDNEILEGKINIYYDRTINLEHAVFLYGEINPKEVVLTRIHSECFTGDVFRSLRCDCGEQLIQSAKMIKTQGSGIILYIRGHEGRGIGLSNKIKAYTLQDQGLDTYQANRHLGFKDDARDYTSAITILNLLEITSINLITNNPDKRTALGNLVVQTTNIDIPPNVHNERYLKSKKKINSQKQPPISMSWMSDTTLPQRRKLKVAVIKTIWNESLITPFTDNIIKILKKHEVSEINIYQAPGAFEIPYIAQKIAPKYHVILCLGAIIKGKTLHFELISSEVTRGLMKVQLQTWVPIVDGILSCYDTFQVIERTKLDSVETQTLPLTTIHMGLFKMNN